MRVAIEAAGWTRGRSRDPQEAHSCFARLDFDSRWKEDDLLQHNCSLELGDVTTGWCCPGADSYCSQPPRLRD